MNWSWLRQYSSGSGGMFFLPPHGVLRLTGMWLCSGNQSDSKPRSSAALASSTGWTDLSVGKIITPSSMGFSPCGVRRPFYPFQPPSRNQRPGALLDPKYDEDVPRPSRRSPAAGPWPLIEPPLARTPVCSTKRNRNRAVSATR